MNKLTLRGQTKVNAQWQMYCLVHNIEKLQSMLIALIPSKSALVSMLQAHKTIQVSLNYNLHKILIKE